MQSDAGPWAQDCAADIFHLRQKFLEVIQRVCFVDVLVLAPAQHARKSHRDAGLVPGTALDSFEPEFEHERRAHAAHRSEFFDGGPPDNGIDFAKFLVGQPRIGLREGH